MSNEIKELVERLRTTYFEETVFSLHDVRDAANALEALVAERDSLREVVNNLSCNWIDCPHCDRNKELMETFINKEEKKET